MFNTSFRVPAVGGIFCLLSIHGLGCSEDNPVSPGLDSGSASLDATILVEAAVAEDGTADSSGQNDGGDGGTAPWLGNEDRAGRVAIVHALVDPRYRNAWNQLAIFASPDVFFDGGTVQEEFQARLVTWDLMDSVNDWDGGLPEGGSITTPVDAGPDVDAGTVTVRTFPHPLVRVLQNDLLILDTTKPFSATGYLDIEVNGAAHATCGGRWMNDDAVDKTLSYLIKRRLTGVSDGVDAPAKPASLIFPYLAAP